MSAVTDYKRKQIGVQICRGVEKKVKEGSIAYNYYCDLEDVHEGDYVLCTHRKFIQFKSGTQRKKEGFTVGRVSEIIESYSTPENVIENQLYGQTICKINVKEFDKRLDQVHKIRKVLFRKRELKRLDVNKETPFNIVKVRYRSQYNKPINQQQELFTFINPIKSIKVGSYVLLDLPADKKWNYFKVGRVEEIIQCKTEASLFKKKRVVDGVVISCLFKTEEELLKRISYTKKIKAINLSKMFGTFKLKREQRLELHNIRNALEIINKSNISMEEENI